jgi:hypothetical protein
MTLPAHLPASNPLKNPLTKNQVPASSLGNTQSAKANFAGQAVFGQAKGSSGLLQAKDGRGSDGGDFLIHGPLRKSGSREALQLPFVLFSEKWAPMLISSLTSNFRQLRTVRMRKVQWL